MEKRKYIVEFKDGQFLFSPYLYSDGDIFTSRSDMKGRSLQEAIDNNEQFDISLELDNEQIDANYIKELLQYFENTSINCEDIVIKYREDYIKDTDEINKLNEIATAMQDSKTSCKINLNETGSEINKFLIAQQEVENLANQINNLTIDENGQRVPLSTFEKFVVVYNYAANRVYNMDKENYFENNDMRTWIGLLTGDYAICSGYSSLLKCLCDRVFDKKELKCIKQSCSINDKENNNLGVHANNIILINDEKYNINGCYYADSCWDCPKPEKNKDVSYDFCAIPLQQIFENNKYNVGIHDTKNLYNKENLEEIFYDDKTYREILKWFDIDIPYYNKAQLADIAMQTNNQIRQENDRKIEKIEQEIANLRQDEEIAKLLQTPYLEMVPKSFYEKYPEFIEIEEYIDSLNMGNLNSLNIEKLEKYNKFCAQHEQEINDFAEFAKEKIGNVKYNIEGKLYRTLKSKETKSEIFEYYIEKEAKKQLNQQTQNVLTGHPEFFDAPKIDERAFYNGFRAVAQMYGITGEAAIEQYAKKQIELRRQGYICEFTPIEKSQGQQHEDEGIQR